MRACTRLPSAATSNGLVLSFRSVRRLWRGSPSRGTSLILKFSSAPVYVRELESLVPAGIVKKIEEQEALLPMPRYVEGLADDPSIHNPLQRSQRLGTGWFGVICEFEGVLVESHWEIHMQAWLKVADELGYPKPLGQSFRRVRGLRDDVVVSRVFNWTQNTIMANKIAERKRKVYEELTGGRQPAEMLEAKPFLHMLHRYAIPVATASALPEKRVHGGLKRSGMQQYFNTVITAEDGGATEVEWYFMYAGQQIQRPPMRCIVIGESNTTVEAAHELGMKCIIVSGNNPVYNFTSADLVVRDLSQLSFLNLKKLFGQEGRVEPRLAADSSGGRGPEAMYDQASNDFSDDVESGTGSSYGRGMAFQR